MRRSDVPPRGVLQLKRKWCVDYLGGVQVQGLAAITANNGWAMALTGATIVITGLSLLSFIISQLHKIVEALEKKEKKEETDKGADAPAAKPSVAESDILGDLAAAARIYRALTTNLGESFTLANLYEAFAKENLPHPHITVRELRDAGYLTPAGEGTFSWNNV